jgi:hypothetical protein
MSLPKASIKSTKTNMWFRSDTPCLDIVSTLDGACTYTIVATDYGPDLWVGWNKNTRNENNYKAMASFCLTIKIKQIIIKAINSTATGLNRNVSYTETK